MAAPALPPAGAQVGSRNWAAAQPSVASTYLLPTVGPLPDPEEARQKQLELEVRPRRAAAADRPPSGSAQRVAASPRGSGLSLFWLTD